MRNLFVPGSVIAVLLVAVAFAFWQPAFLLYLIVLTGVALGVIDRVQTAHSLATSVAQHDDRIKELDVAARA